MSYFWFTNTGTQSVVLEIKDNAYKSPAQTITIPAGKAKMKKPVSVNIAKKLRLVRLFRKTKRQSAF